MSESVFEAVSRLVKTALLEQDSATYHGDAGDIKGRADRITSQILTVIDTDAADRKRREMINPVRSVGVQIGHGSTQINRF